MALLMRYGRSAQAALRRGLSTASDVELQRLALEEKKLAQAFALEEKKRALEEKKLALGRGALEAVFGVSRDTAQMVNLMGAGIVVVASGAFLVSGMLHDLRAQQMIATSKSDGACTQQT